MGAVTITQRRRLRALTGDISRPRALASAHYGASGAREFAQWAPTNGSADADLLPDLETLRNRSRDLQRNHGVAAGAHQTLVDNVIGIGPRLAAKPDYRALGKDLDWARDWSTAVESLWRTWANDTECDVAGSLTLDGQTRQLFRGAMMNGDAICLPLWLPRQGSRWRTRLQLIESDRLSNPQMLPDTDTLRGGIEIDEYGRPLAYHIRKSHPGDAWFGFAAISSDWTRIPAETPWGRKRIIHAHDKERTGQTRGKPLLASVISQFRMLDNYQRTELQSAVVNAMIAAFIETPLPAESVLEMLGGPGDERFQQYMSDVTSLTAPLKGGAIIPTLPGNKITPFIPGHPSDAFAPFVESTLRHIGVGLNLPYELLFKDFSKTNYSSARAALLEAWRFFLGRRKWVEDCWLKPVYDLWLEEAVNLGLVEAADFYGQRSLYSRVKWVWPGRGWIDPVKEVQAAILRIEGGISTYEQECAEQGLDWEEIFEQQAVEKRRRATLELDPLPRSAAARETAPSEREEEGGRNGR